VHRRIAIFVLQIYVSAKFNQQLNRRSLISNDGQHERRLSKGVALVDVRPAGNEFLNFLDVAFLDRIAKNRDRCECRQRYENQRRYR